MIKETILQISENFQNLVSETESIKKASEIMIQCISNGGKVIFCGNGGSAADAQHLAAELVGRYRIDRNAMAGIALSTDTSIITAIGNDYSFEDIFSRQIEAVGKKIDILYAISTSGKSLNIIKAIKAAKNKNMFVIGVTGDKGNDMEGKCDILINVPANRPDRIQEMHIAVGQILCELVENSLFAKN